MVRRININADIGEGYGHYRIGDDAAVMDLVQSVNVACGMHGGDPTVMRAVCLKAREKGVSIGAHPGFNDLWGFGRRPIRMAADDLEYLVAYQIGALAGMAAYAGVKVTHVKAHGALYNMCAVEPDYAMAVGRAIRTVDPSMAYLALAGSAMETAALELGLKLAREGFIDRLYDDEGKLCPRSHPDAVIRDPTIAAQRAVRMVLDGEIVSISGKVLPARFDSLCVHGDEPSAIALASACRQALESAGVELVPLPDMLKG